MTLPAELTEPSAWPMTAELQPLDFGVFSTLGGPVPLLKDIGPGPIQCR